MTLRTAWLGAVAAIAITGSATAANFNGWYVGLEGGGNWIADWDQTVAPATAATATLDTGWGALASVGYAYPSNWRTELELGYRANDVSGLVSSGGTPLSAGGDLWEASLMANVVYDVRLADRIGLAVGLGAGADYTKLTLTGFGSDGDWNFAYQGLAGLNYSLGDRTTAFVNYRYFNASAPEFAYTTTSSAIAADDIQKHTVTVGLRFALSGQEAPAADPLPPPPPPPVEPVGPSRQFIVFFGFNKYNLTSGALRVIDEAITAAKETGSATLVITGHTDTVGTGTYNQRLSLRRSNAVKAEMVRKGISPASITTTGKGETELLVQTADNVKEPQNRRATIDLN